jgi:hypothetical protein
LIAVIIEPESAAAASGVAAPAAKSSPPPASAARTELHRVEVRRRSLQASAAEPAEQLLGAVSDEQEADRDAGEQAKQTHLLTPFVDRRPSGV